MLGVNNYVVVIVINALAENKKPTNYFDQASTIMVAAQNSIRDSMGNQHARTNIQKQAYCPTQVKNVRQAYGITGTNFETHSPFINGKRMSLDTTLPNKSEVVLIKNGLDFRRALSIANQHRIIPERTTSTLPRQLGEVLPPQERPRNIVYEIVGTGEEPGPIFGAGGAGQPGAYGDFGGINIFEEHDE